MLVVCPYLITNTGVLITSTPVFADYSLVLVIVCSYLPIADCMLVFADYSLVLKASSACNHIEWGKYTRSKYPNGLKPIIDARNAQDATKFVFKTLVVNMVRVQGLYLFAIFALIRLLCLYL